MRGERGMMRIYFTEPGAFEDFPRMEGWVSGTPVAGVRSSRSGRLLARLKCGHEVRVGRAVAWRTVRGRMVAVGGEYRGRGCRVKSCGRKNDGRGEPV